MRETRFPRLRSNIMSILSHTPMNSPEIKKELDNMNEYAPINLTNHLFQMEDEGYPIRHTYNAKEGHYYWSLTKGTRK